MKMGEADVNDSLVETPQIEDNKGCLPFYCSVRFRMTVHIFFLNVLLYMHRVNLSLAVVCMVDLRPHKSSSALLSPNLTAASTNNVTFHDNTSGSYLYETIPDTSNKTLLDHVDETATEQSNMLDWEKPEVAILLSVYFYGCVIIQIPSGVLSTKFSGKLIIAVVMSITGACSLLVPVCARTSIYLVFVLRVVMGICGGTVVPVGYNVLTSWAPPSERAFMIGFTATGALTGAIISYSTSGLLCEYGFDGGWPSIFYIQGLMTFVSAGLWVFDAASIPGQHRRISECELKYLTATITHSVETTKKPKTPWQSMLTSKPLWAVFAAHCALNWSFFSILINVPLFMEEVLKFEIKQNGLFSALPYIFSLISILISGKMANIVDRKIKSPLLSRRLFTAGSLLGSGLCLVVTGYMTPELRHFAVTLLCLACCFFGLAWGGFFINHPEFAGRFAAIAMAITNTGGIIMGALASMSAGLLTPNSTQSEWQRVFYISAGLNIFGTVMFSMFSTTTLQPWAQPNTSITVNANDDTTPETKFIPAVKGVNNSKNSDQTNI